MTIIWAALLGSVLAYVLTSMADAAFDLTQAISLTVILIVAVLLLDLLVVKEPDK